MTYTTVALPDINNLEMIKVPRTAQFMLQTLPFNSRDRFGYPRGFGINKPMDAKEQSHSVKAMTPRW